MVNLPPLECSSIYFLVLSLMFSSGSKDLKDTVGGQIHFLAEHFTFAIELGHGVANMAYLTQTIELWCVKSNFFSAVSTACKFWIFQLNFAVTFGIGLKATVFFYALGLDVLTLFVDWLYIYVVLLWVYYEGSNFIAVLSLCMMPYSSFETFGMKASHIHQ